MLDVVRRTIAETRERAAAALAPSRSLRSRWRYHVSRAAIFGRRLTGRLGQIVAPQFAAQSGQRSRCDRRRHHRAVGSHRLLHHRLSQGGRCPHLQGRTDGDARGAVYLRPRRTVELRHRPARGHQRDPNSHSGAHLPAHPGYQGQADAAEGGRLWRGRRLPAALPSSHPTRSSATPRFRPVCARCSAEVFLIAIASLLLGIAAYLAFAVLPLRVVDRSFRELGSDQRRC